MSATHLLIDGNAACGHAGDSPLTTNEPDVTCTRCRRSFGRYDAGGDLPSGGQQVYNTTGQPIPVTDTATLDQQIGKLRGKITANPDDRDVHLGTTTLGDR